MIQHRWAVWSGVMGATASCLAKLAVDDEPINPMMKMETVCQSHLTEDLDVLVSRVVHRVLGDLMIKYGVNLTKLFRLVRVMIEGFALRMRLFEVDWCRFLTLGPRILCFVLMLLLNVSMTATLVKALQVSGSVVGSAVITAANFIMSALLGFLIWHERIPGQWWLGFTCVAFGLALLSSVKTDDKSHESKRKTTSIPQTRVNKTSNRTPPVQQTARPSAKPTPISTPWKKKAPSPPAPTVSRLVPESSHSKLDTLNTETATPPTTYKPSGASNILTNVKKKKPKKRPFQDPGTSFTNECPMCDDPLFDDGTGEAEVSVADLSPHCYHMVHGKCLKARGIIKSKNCPVCDKKVERLILVKQAAHFPSFWMERVESCLKQLGAPLDDKGDKVPLPASNLRSVLGQEMKLSNAQKIYIHDDPSGNEKGLVSALEWGGSKDYNTVKKGHRGWAQCLLTKGKWKYDKKRDELWLWEWGLYPRQRCAQCQLMKKPLPFACEGCEGSSEQAYYCSAACQKRDWQHGHKMNCQLWQKEGPAKKA